MFKKPKKGELPKLTMPELNLHGLVINGNTNISPRTEKFLKSQDFEVEVKDGKVTFPIKIMSYDEITNFLQNKDEYLEKLAQQEEASKKTKKKEVKEDPKVEAEVKENPKVEAVVKEEPKVEAVVKEEPKAEVKVDPKAEVKVDPKPEVKEEPKKQNEFLVKKNHHDKIKKPLKDIIVKEKTPAEIYAKILDPLKQQLETKDSKRLNDLKKTIDTLINTNKDKKPLCYELIHLKRNINDKLRSMRQKIK